MTTTAASTTTKSSLPRLLPMLPRRSSDSGARGCGRRLTGRYLSEEMCRGLLRYKYDGEDKSYLYRYILQPMNAFLIQFVPMRMAPNLMTLCGLAIVVAAYATTYHYSPDFKQQMPDWVYAGAAIALFAYQTIDNLDGRQARRTGSSSPLGLLFDHGVDALNCTFAGLLLASIYSVGLFPAPIMFLFWNIGYIPFVLATWEEYHTGKLTLAEVNGPSDGMFCCMVWCMLGYFFPGMYHSTYAGTWPALFKGTFVASLPVNATPLLVGYFGILLTIVGNLWQVSKRVNLLSSPSPFRQLTPFVMLSTMTWSWVLLWPDFFVAHARVFCFSCGFLFCQMICSMMIAHVCHADYKPLRRVLIPLTAAWLNCVMGPLVAPHVFPLLSPDLTLYALLAFNFLAWLHFVWNAILEICELLSIRCFVIQPKDVGHDGATPASRAAKDLQRKVSDGAHRAVLALEQIVAPASPSPEAPDAGRHTGIRPVSPTTAEALIRNCEFDEDDDSTKTDDADDTVRTRASSRGTGPAAAAGRRRKSAANKE